MARDQRRITERASAVEDSRIRSLEQEVRSLREGFEEVTSAHPPEPLVPAEEEKVVTLDSLKGKSVLFVIMPFKEEFEDVWNGGIKRAATGTGLMPVRIDMITKSTEITEDIVAAIKQAKVVLVDVTSNNPNVMFEAGYALALKKEHIIISQSADFLTFDIQNIRTLPYKNTWKGIEQLHLDLQNFIKGTLGEKSQKRKKPAQRTNHNVASSS
jgi:nucleoside 2-deoxyribosyltransferase